jgi:hypothetical protein
MKLLNVFIAVFMFLCLLVGNTAFSAPPSNKNNDNPPGWQKGEKEGWKSDRPPGLEGKQRGNTAKGNRKGKKDTPPGWQKGEKEGWKSDRPPGLEGRQRGNTAKGNKKGKKGR